MKIGFTGIDLPAGKTKYQDEKLEALAAKDEPKKVSPYFAEFIPDEFVQVDAIVVPRAKILDLLIYDLESLDGRRSRADDPSERRLSPEFHTLAVLPLENKTTTSEVEQILTRSLVRAFVEKSSYRVINDPSQADAVLRGVVSRLSASPVIFRRGTFGSTFLVTLQAQVELQDQRSGKVLYKNDGYIFREQYQINVDVENFFSELNPALGRVAGDFASSVVTTLLESY